MLRLDGCNSALGLVLKQFGDSHQLDRMSRAQRLVRCAQSAAAAADKSELERTAPASGVGVPCDR